MIGIERKRSNPERRRARVRKSEEGRGRVRGRETGIERERTKREGE